MTKTMIATPDGDRSPFDRIKQVRPDGVEYWSARALQGLMGYARWENLQSALARAMQSASNTGMDVSSHFLRSQEMVLRGQGGGKPRDDFHLSRHAAYLVAMNGDPNKPEVAAAQSYFAVRTREAEVTPQRALTPRELAQMVIEAEDRAEAATNRAQLAMRAVAELEPAAHSWETLAGESTGDYSLRDVAQILNRDRAIVTGQNRLMGTLREFGWVDGKGTPYQREVDNGRLVCRVLPYEHPHTGEPRLSSQVRVTVKGLHELHKRLATERQLRLNLGEVD